MTTATVTGERAELISALQTARYFLRHTARDLSTEQASRRTTASELTVGGVIKHVARTEAGWLGFIEDGPAAMNGGKSFAELTDEDYAQRAAEFAIGPGETLEGVLAEYDEVAARTDEAVRTVESLDTRHPLPDAPWFTEADWSIRQALLHIVAETAQHAGHADIIREALDGAKSMG